MKQKIILIISCSLIACSSHFNKSINTEGNELKIISHKDSLAIRLIELYGSDQIARRNHKIFTSLDTINFNELMQFIKTNGFPNKKLLGDENMKVESVKMAAISILLHNPHRLVNEELYLRVLLKEVERGNLNREMLATILDKYYWVKKDKNGNRKVLYGTQFGKPCMLYRKESDSVRAIIGLQPLPDSLFIDCN